MEIKFLKEISEMKRFILVMSISTLLFLIIFSCTGFLLGYYLSFGFIEYLLGKYFIGEILMIFSPIFSFIIYIIYFDYPEPMVPITKFKNHVPKIHFLDNNCIKNLEV